MTTATTVKAPLDTSRAAYIEQMQELVSSLTAENRRLRDLADDRGRRIAGAVFLIDQWDPMAERGFAAVLLADLRTVLGSHRNPASGAQ